MRTVTESADSVEELREILLSKGFVEPFEVEELEPEAPTEKQLSYAKDLGIQIPNGATKHDLSTLIDRSLSNDSEPNPDLLVYAKVMGIDYPKYVGKKALYKLIFENLGLRDKMAFFVFSVYRYLSEDRGANLGIHPHKGKIYDFVDSLLLEDRIVKSITKYEGEDLRFFGTIRFPDGNEATGGSTKTIGYQIVSEFVSVTFNTPKSRTWQPKNEFTIGSDSRKQATSKRPPSGCAIILMVVFAACLIDWVSNNLF